MGTWGKGPSGFPLQQPADSLRVRGSWRDAPLHAERAPDLVPGVQRLLSGAWLSRPAQASTRGQSGGRSRHWQACRAGLREGRG